MTDFLKMFLQALGHGYSLVLVVLKTCSVFDDWELCLASLGIMIKISVLPDHVKFLLLSLRVFFVFISAGLTMPTLHALPGRLEGHIKSLGEEIGTRGDKVNLDGVGAELCLPQGLSLIRELDKICLD